MKTAEAKPPFGQFLVPGVPGGTDAEIVFRPQRVRIDFDRAGKGPLPTPSDGVPARGVVERARFLGHQRLVEFRMDFDGSLLKGDGTQCVPARSGPRSVAYRPAQPVFRLSQGVSCPPKTAWSSRAN